MGDGIAAFDVTKPIDPYSRLYWRLVDDEKFANIYTDDAAFALWCRLLMAADMAHPASASLPHGTRKGALAALVDARLVDIYPAGRYRIHGLKAERDKRLSGPGKDPDGSPPGAGREPDGNLARAYRRDEKRKDETSREPALSDDEAREQLDKLADVLDTAGALPEKKANGEHRRPYHPTTDTEVIERARAVIADESAPDWKRDAARAQLEAMRVQP